MNWLVMDWKMDVLFPTRVRSFLRHYIQTTSRSQPTPYPVRNNDKVGVALSWQFIFIQFFFFFFQPVRIPVTSWCVLAKLSRLKAAHLSVHCVSTGQLKPTMRIPADMFLCTKAWLYLVPRLRKFQRRPSLLFLGQCYAFTGEHFNPITCQHSW
jgi:hypothetical protein